jgi:predicted alpha/beta-fold hydrolase
MPLIQTSGYKAPLLFENAHLNTVYPFLSRKLPWINYTRRRIDTPDGDFLDLDISSVGSKSVILIVHGLESNSKEPQILGMVRASNEKGFDAVVLNMRGCSGEDNRLLRAYHSGSSEDVLFTLKELKKQNYTKIYLVGFSLGGNAVLKMMGELKQDASNHLNAVVTVSVPCCLKASADELAKPENKIYMRKFIKSLKGKIVRKVKQFPDTINLQSLSLVQTFREFDNLYTAPVHGFKDAEEYWGSCSSKYFVQDIYIPTLLINSKDDPFLGKDCYPLVQGKESTCFHLETPEHGGHVGFVKDPLKQEYWHEKRIIDFLVNGM